MEAFLLFSVAKGILRLCEEANQRGACLGDCNAEMQRAALFDAWSKVQCPFYVQQRLVLLDDRSMGAVSNRLGLCQSGAGSL